MNAFELYRYTHPDGTAKEWAYCNLGNGLSEIRWGPSNQLRQSQTKPLREAQVRAEEKVRKGYRLVGTVYLDDLGQRVKAQAARPIRKNPVDLNALFGGERDSFYF